MTEQNNLPQTTPDTTPEKRKPGRPRIWPTPEPMAAAINQYFLKCEQGKIRKWINKRGEYQEAILPIIPELTGLALHLGFASYASFWEYTKYPEYSDVLARAKSVMEHELLQNALLGLVERTTADRILSVRHGWKVDENTKIEILIVCD